MVPQSQERHGTTCVEDRMASGNPRGQSGERTAIECGGTLRPHTTPHCTSTEDRSTHRARVHRGNKQGHVGMGDHTRSQTLATIQLTSHPDDGVNSSTGEMYALSGTQTQRAYLLAATPWPDQCSPGH